MTEPVVIGSKLGFDDFILNVVGVVLKVPLFSFGANK